MYQSLNQKVQVVWHHDPCQQTVPLAIKMEQSLLDHLSHAGIAQRTGAMLGVDPLFNPLPHESLFDSIRFVGQF